MKKTFALLLSAIMAFSITACDNKNSEPDSQTTIGGTTAERVVEKLKSEDYPLPKYEKEPLIDEASIGYAYYNLNEIVDLEKVNYNDYAEKFNDFNIMGFYKMSVIEIVSQEEIIRFPHVCYVRNYSIFYYKVLVEYDYINQKSINEEVIIAFSFNDTFQIEGMPIYDVGDTFAGVLKDIDSSEHYINLCQNGLLFDVFEINGQEIGFTRGTKLDAWDQYDMGLLENEKSVVTTTANNPVKYYQKVKMSDIASFFREDWNERKIIISGDAITPSKINIHEFNEFPYLITGLQQAYSQKDTKNISITFEDFQFEEGDKLYFEITNTHYDAEGIYCYEYPVSSSDFKNGDLAIELSDDYICYPQYLSMDNMYYVDEITNFNKSFMVPGTYRMEIYLMKQNGGLFGTYKTLGVEDENGYLPYEIDYDIDALENDSERILFFTEKQQYSLEKLIAGEDKVQVYIGNLTNQSCWIQGINIPYYKKVSGNWEGQCFNLADPGISIFLRSGKTIGITVLYAYSSEYIKPGLYRMALSDILESSESTDIDINELSEDVFAEFEIVE